MSKKMILVDADTLMGMGFGGDRRDRTDRYDEIKTFKRIKKLITEVEEEKKKNAPKKEQGFMKDWSVAKRTAFFAILGPPLGLTYIFCLLMIVRGMAAFVVGVNH